MTAAALILAGGASRRMPGSSKLVRPWASTTVLGAVVRAARDAGLAPVVVVAPAGRCAFPGAEAADLVIDMVPGGGRADSLAAGLEALAEGPVVVLLGDEPGVRPGTIRNMVAMCDRTGADAGRVAYTDRPGHPVWLGPAGRAAVTGLTGDAAVWDHLAAADLHTVLFPDETPAPIDVDSPDDLERARRRAEAP